MTEERDMVNFALPFTFGVVFASMIPMQYAHMGTGLPMFLCIIPLTYLLSSRDCEESTSLTFISIITLAFLTGMACLNASECMHIYGIESRTFLDNAGDRFCRSLKQTIYSIPFADKETGAIISALITGERTQLSGDTVNAFRNSGASHILALSGLHLGLIYGIMKKITVPVGNTPSAKRMRSAIIIAACGFYTVATGAGDSIVRAFLFIALHEAGSLTFRHTGIRQILHASLVIQLALDPTAIRSVSFQLSYAAMAGIAYIYPYLQRFWPERTVYRQPAPFRKIWESAALSISCQITTAPLAWYYFSTFPQHFLLANMTAIPLTGIIIPGALATIALQSIGICPEQLVKVTETLVESLESVLEIIAGM